MRFYRKIFLLEGFIALFVFLGFARFVNAANLNLVPAGGNFKVGEEFTVGVKIDSSGEAMNAAQASITFPKNLIEVVAVQKDESIFTFWLNEPEFSNAQGTVSFIGGVHTGISGGSLQILKIVFRAKAQGIAIISFEDGAVTANDGSGTNILKTLSGAQFFIEQTKAQATSTVPVATTTQAVLPNQLVPPPEIKRTPAPARALPARPEVKIELYPNQPGWYNVSSPFLAAWDLPPDIFGMSTALNNEAKFIPAPQSEGLTEGKLLDALDDGIWYLHVRFRNNIGWGETSHSRIAVDTLPPFPFRIEIATGKVSDNPRPLLEFSAKDSLSGIEYYRIRTDEGEGVDVAKSEYALPPQAPGKHRVVVKAVDRAGNSREAVVEINVLPIPPPSITFITPFITSDSDESLVVKGQGKNGHIVHVKVMDKKEQVVAAGKAQVAENAEWLFTLEKNLKRGEYVVQVWDEDERGALSLPVQAGAVIIKAKPVVKLGSLELTASHILLLLILALFGVWYWLDRQRVLRQLRYGLVEYDFHKMIALLEKDALELEKRLIQGVSSEAVRQDLGHPVKSLLETIAKIKNYLPREVEKLKE